MPATTLLEQLAPTKNAEKRALVSDNSDLYQLKQVMALTLLIIFHCSVD